MRLVVPGGWYHDVVADGALEVLLEDVVGGQEGGPLPTHPVQPAVTDYHRAVHSVRAYWTHGNIL